MYTNLGLVTAAAMQDAAFKYINATRAFHIGVVASGGKSPDVQFGDQSSIREVRDMSNTSKREWESGSQVLGLFIGGKSSMATIGGMAPYLVGDVTEV